MYKRHKIGACIFFVISIIILYMLEIRLTQSFIGFLVTFFSIVFGFYITALSVLFSSNFSKNLWKERDPFIKGQKKIHTLINYFKSSLFLLLLSIVVSLTISLTGMTIDSDYRIIPESFWGNALHLERVFMAVSLGIATTNIVFMTLLLKIVLNGFLTESSSPR